MHKHILLLKGINVGGKNAIKMAALKSCMENCGFQNVQTYIQSGNVYFESLEQNTLALKAQIEQAIKLEFSLEISCLVINEKEFSSLITNNPFIKEDLPIEQMHITIFSNPIEYTLELSDKQLGKDRYVLNPKAIYLVCPDGYGKTKLHNTFLEKKLNTIATTRNWKTMLYLNNMLQE